VNNTHTDIPAHLCGPDLSTKTAIEAMIMRRMRTTGETRRQASLHVAGVLRADAENTVSVYAALDSNLARLEPSVMPPLLPRPRPIPAWTP
jgi:hypothetical protein